MNEDRGTMRGRIRVEGLRSLLIAVAIIHNSSFLIHNSACADTFKCGVGAVNDLAAALAAQTNATGRVEASKLAQELDGLLDAIRKDDFATDKAREDALNRARAILIEADHRLPEGFGAAAKALSVLADDATLPEVAYAVALQPENTAAFTRDAKGVLDWLYGTAAGIQPGDDGSWDDFELAPIPDSRLAFVEATKDIQKGKVRSAWKYEDGKCRWTFAIPVGTRATVCVNGMCARYEPGEHTLEIKKR